jgi:hypothetical protein
LAFFRSSTRWSILIGKKHVFLRKLCLNRSIWMSMILNRISIQSRSFQSNPNATAPLNSSPHK